MANKSTVVLKSHSLNYWLGSNSPIGFGDKRVASLSKCIVWKVEFVFNGEKREKGRARAKASEYSENQLFY